MGRKGWSGRTVMRQLRLRWLGLSAGICCLWAALLVLQSGPAWAGFDEGVAAWERGDYAAALREIRPLAEQGNAKAQVFLGVMYAEGQGVPQDYVQAHLWFNLAAAQGAGDAGKKRDLVVNLMTPVQIAEAQRLAREWCPRPETPLEPDRSNANQ